VARKFARVSTDEVKVADHSAYDFVRTASFTIYQWIRPDRLDVEMHPLIKWGEATGGYPFNLQVAGDAANDPIGLRRYDGTFNPIVTLNWPGAVGDWVFVMCGRDASQANELFITAAVLGKLLPDFTTADDNTTGTTNNGNTVRLGTQFFGAHWSGDIGRTIICNAAHPLRLGQAVMLGGTPPDVVLDLKIKGTSGPEPDEGPFHQHGVVSGTRWVPDPLLLGGRRRYWAFGPSVTLNTYPTLVIGDSARFIGEAVVGNALDARDATGPGLVIGAPLSFIGEAMLGALEAVGGTTFNSSLTATLTTAGGLLKQTNKALSGTLATAGALAKQTARTLLGTLTTAGGLVKQAQKVLAGALTTAGGLTAVRVVLKALDATLSTAGALTKQTNKALAGTLTTAGALTKQLARTLTGALTFTGGLLKQTNKALAGALTTSGALSTIKVFLRTLTATLTTAGALTKQTARTLSGTLTTAGALTKQAQKALQGALTTTGDLLKRTQKALSGAIAPSGALSAVRIILKALAGSLATAGAITKQAQKTLGGTVATAGALTRSIGKGLAGTLAPSGTVGKLIARTLTAALSWIGDLAASLGFPFLPTGRIIVMTRANATVRFKRINAMADLRRYNSTVIMRRKAA
jgi:hypothetical protein